MRKMFHGRYWLLVSLFAIFWALASAAVYWIIPSVIAAAYEGRSLSFLNNILSGRGSVSLEAYLELWAQRSGAIPPAGILHMATICMIAFFRKKHRDPNIESPISPSVGDLALIFFAGAFLVLAALVGPRGDYFAYVREWVIVLEGGDPWSTTGNFNGFGPMFSWQTTDHFNAYGPLFNALAPVLWINPLANKVLFAFSYVAFLCWLILDIGARRGLSPVSWPVVSFWLLNPFVWVEIVYYAHLDVLLALACVVSVHGCLKRTEILSGISLATGILLKYIPIVILPFLVIRHLRARWQLLASCAATIFLGFSLSVWMWGTSTFAPMLFAASRAPNGSVYDLLNQMFTPQTVPSLPLRSELEAANTDFVPLFCLAITGLGIFGWCAAKRTEPALSAVLALLVTFLFYHVGYVNYEMILFLVASYWAVLEWNNIKRDVLVQGSLIAHFGVLAAIDIAIVLGFVGYANYGTFFIALKFLTGLILLAALMRFSTRNSA